MSTPRRFPVVPLIVDAALVILFAAIGRATHEGDVFGPFGAGLATTAWPFLVALLVGWSITRAWRRPVAVLRTGLPVWAVTVVLGMVLRALSGQGVPVAFVIVATITLALFLLGWRGVAQLVARSRRA
ncbi:DUF3054 domain-containing protein [Microbacterium sp. lyk4-40-TSB-66]|uniref:DUF3054 domain-containing protein n=1 Tax=Microbacterium sp. lyk4-40-TSB-66 TaxID=3040294 RepID=UPI0025518EA3|nr:DUF3054 domain-containing protein [Microbacterium sp. lyk4-40-TSB-66]